MSIPDYQACMLPLLKFASSGKPLQMKDVVEPISKEMGITSDQLEQTLPSGSPVFFNRLSWAKSYLKHAGLLSFPERGVFQITEEGQKVIMSDVEKIDNSFLSQFPSFQEFKTRKKSLPENSDSLDPDTIEELLLEFAEIADEWFQNASFVIDYWKFMNRFFQMENLENAEWKDIQKLGEHIHALQSLAIARKNAFGEPNYPIEQYRETLKHLAHGEGSVEERMRWFIDDKNAASKYIGTSSLSEIMSQLNGETHVPYNRRDLKAAEFLGIDPGFERGDDFPRQFAKFNQSIKPIFESYKEIVGPRTEVPIGLEVDQFFSWLYETKNLGKDKPPIDKDAPKVWEYAPGRAACYWESYFEEGIAAIGWDEIGDLKKYKSKEEITAAIKAQSETDVVPRNDSLALWQFANEMKVGDTILAKKGRRSIVGIGTVNGKYQYKPEREVYHHTIPVEWKEKGFWELPSGLNLTTKTLTDLSPYPEHVSKLIGLVTGNSPPPTIKKYWWLNCNPKFWDVRKAKIGDRVIYTSINEDGNKRQKYKYFQDARVGDKVFTYVTSPVRQLTSMLSVTQEVGETEEGEGIELEIIKHFTNPLSWDALKENNRLTDCEPLISNQGSLFYVTEEEQVEILKLFEGDVETEVEEYGEVDALEDLYMPAERFRKILERLETKKNIILQGPPGVGKTFVARRIAYALMREKDPGRVRMVQFHQSYSYEDFVKGYRPSKKGGFELKDGVFFEFCQKARNDDRPYVFIIDEINRGNLSKILGEIMMLIEHDKRAKAYAIPLAYDEESDQEFYVPPNVYIIGLMNTADRSLAMVDYALRRRFSFIDLKPAFGSEKFSKRLEELCGDSLGTRIQDVFQELNSKISSDNENLGSGFCVGHSYFCLGKTDLLDSLGYRRIIDTEIAPLLNEYWFDQPQIAEEWIERLMAITG